MQFESGEKVGFRARVAMKLIFYFRQNRNSDEILSYINFDFSFDFDLLLSMSKSEYRFRCRFQHRNLDSDFDFGIGILILTSEYRFKFCISMSMSRFTSIFHRNSQTLYFDCLSEFRFRPSKSKSEF
jgi:hypothetical protein